MSQLNVDTIKKADGTGNLTVPAETGTVVTTASPSLGRRNLIINGAMQVAQRGTSWTSPTSEYTIDRWEWNNSNFGAWDVAQSTDAPEGFKYSLKATCTTADSSPASGDYVFIRYKHEVQDTEHLKMGTSNAVSLTLSFWVKSNKTGTFGIESQVESSGTKETSADVTINAADTWEYKTVSIPANTAYAPTNASNASGLTTWFWINGGSTFQGTPPSNWDNQTSGRAGTLTSDIGDAVDDYFAITGVQLEVGDTATPFEHRSYGEELALCQRYYEKWSEYGDGANTMIATMAAYDSGGLYGGIFFPYKRVKPSISFGPSSGDPFRQYGNNTYVALAASEMLAQDIGNRTARLNADQSGQAVQGYAYFLQFINGLGGYIEFDAEL